MKRIAERVLCRDCPKRKDIVSEGEKFGVYYIVRIPNKRYYICDNPDISWDDVMKEMSTFMDYVPKFGKYEIEEFVEYAMKEALLLTKDITNLFYMELLFEDFHNDIRVSYDKIREKVLKCFDIVEEQGNDVWLRFKWEKLS